MSRAIRMLGVASVAAALLVASATPSRAQATQRPLADFLGPNMAEPISVIWLETGNPVWAYFDYFGRVATNNGLSLGSEFSGSVTERPLADGRAAVRVVLHARSVFTYAYDTSQGNAFVFGYPAGQVRNGAAPALADVTITLDFVNLAPGAPLPSLARLSFFPSPDYTLEKLSVVANAAGPLRAAFGVPEGTPGRLHTTQRGLYDAPGLPNSGTGQFPAEKVRLWVVGQ